MSAKKVHREFVHDVANHLTIVDGCVMKALFNLKKEGMGPEDQTYEKLQKANERLKQIIKELRTYREFIHTLPDEE